MAELHVEICRTQEQLANLDGYLHAHTTATIVFEGHAPGGQAILKPKAGGTEEVLNWTEAATEIPGDPKSRKLPYAVVWTIGA